MLKKYLILFLIFALCSLQLQARRPNKKINISYMGLSYFAPIEFASSIMINHGVKLSVETPVSYMKKTKEKKNAQIGFHQYQIAGIYNVGYFKELDKWNTFISADLAIRHISSGGFIAEIFIGIGLMKSFYFKEEDKPDEKRWLKKAVADISTIPSVGLGVGWDFTQNGKSKMCIELKPALIAGTRDFYLAGELALRYKIAK